MPRILQPVVGECPGWFALTGDSGSRRFVHINALQHAEELTALTPILWR